MKRLIGRTVSAVAPSNLWRLMLAGVVAGREDLRHHRKPPALVAGIADGLEEVADLPTCLGEAIDALEQDAVLHAALGLAFVNSVVAVKRYELNQAKATLFGLRRGSAMSPSSSYKRGLRVRG